MDRDDELECFISRMHKEAKERFKPYKERSDALKARLISALESIETVRGK